MTPGEFKEIAKAMKEFGITNVKMGDCEITGPFLHDQSQLKSWSLPNGIQLSEKQESDPSDPIKHKVDQMTSLMKLSDTELVDQLFPDKTEESE